VRVFKLAAGFAVGYVLGSAAGRERYKQIVAAASSAKSHPAVTQVQEKAKALLTRRRDPAGASIETQLPDTQAPVPASRPVRPPQRQ
jgi:hypothetical protein